MIPKSDYGMKEYSGFRSSKPTTAFVSETNERVLVELLDFSIPHSKVVSCFTFNVRLRSNVSGVTYLSEICMHAVIDVIIGVVALKCLSCSKIE